MNDKIKNVTDPILGIRDILQQPTPQELVQWKVQAVTDWGKATMVAFTDARLPRKILDEAVGIDGWECKFERDPKGNLFCYITIHFPNGRIITKGDCGVPSAFESEKGEASDAFKRACFSWGVCADLYDLDIYQIDCINKGTPEKPKWDTWGLKGWKPSQGQVGIKGKTNNSPAPKPEPDPPDESDQVAPDFLDEERGHMDGDEDEDFDFVPDQPMDAFDHWKDSGRLNSIGFTEDNATKRWMDADVKFLWWILNKMSTQSDKGGVIKVNVDRKVCASKEVLYRAHINDLNDDTLRDLAKQVMKEHSND